MLKPVYSTFQRVSIVIVSLVISHPCELTCVPEGFWSNVSNKSVNMNSFVNSFTHHFSVLRQNAACILCSNCGVTPEMLKKVRGLWQTTERSISDINISLRHFSQSLKVTLPIGILNFGMAEHTDNYCNGLQIIRLQSICSSFLYIHQTFSMNHIKYNLKLHMEYMYLVVWITIWGN